MTEEEKLEKIARAICESYSLNPDTPMTKNDPVTGRWEMYKDQAQAAMAAQADIDAIEKNRQRTTAPERTGERLLLI